MRRIFQRLLGRPTGVLGINQRNAHLVYRLNQNRHFALADDKILCKEVLVRHGIPCAETYAVVSRIGDIPQALKDIAVHQALAVKPARGIKTSPRTSSRAG